MMTGLKKIVMMANQGDFLPPIYEKINYTGLRGYIILPVIFTDVTSFEIDILSTGNSAGNQSVIYANTMSIGSASNFWGVRSVNGIQTWYLTNISSFIRIKATLNVLGNNKMSGTFRYNEDGEDKIYEASETTINYNDSEVTLGCDTSNASNRIGSFKLYYFAINTKNGNKYRFVPVKLRGTNTGGLYCYELKEFFTYQS